MAFVVLHEGFLLGTFFECSLSEVVEELIDLGFSASDIRSGIRSGAIEIRPIMPDDE